MKLDFDYTKYPRPMKKHSDTFIYGLMDDLFEAGMNSVRARAVAGSVCELMSNQDLYYHNYTHPLSMFSFATQNGIELTLSERLAVWFHDAIYVPFSSENKKLSVQLFEVLVYDKSYVSDMILSTANHMIDHDRLDQQYPTSIMDLDLCSFAFPYEDFKKVSGLVQKELVTTPQQTIGFYAALLNRAPIFRSEEFSRFEETAQTNIRTYIEEFGNAV